MLALFPGILYLAPFSATILRLGSGITLIYIGYSLLMRREQIDRIPLPIVGYPPAWMVWFAGIVTAVDGFALLMGYGTQLAAIVGMLIALKHICLSGRWASIRAFERSTYALLLLICLTLLITGAGPLGLDLPL